MRLITLISDWTTKDYYVGAVKGRILSLCPTATIVDISHDIMKYSYLQASFVLKSCYKYFPKDTIHIIGIIPQNNKEYPFCVCRYEEQFFIGVDNGLFNILFENQPDTIVELPNTFDSFRELSIMAEAAGKLAAGADLKQLGAPKDDITHLPNYLTMDEDNLISGKVIYIDSYQNCISDITRERFENVGKGRNFTIAVKTNKIQIRQISSTYNEVSFGDYFAIFNSLQLLEIGQYIGQFATFNNIEVNSTIRIKFH